MVKKSRNVVNQLLVRRTQNPINGAAIFLTDREVKHARQNSEKSLLFVLHSIRLENIDRKPVPKGGRAYITPWSGIDYRLEISLYRLKIASGGE